MQINNVSLSTTDCISHPCNVGFSVLLFLIFNLETNLKYREQLLTLATKMLVCLQRLGITCLHLTKDQMNGSNTFFTFGKNHFFYCLLSTLFLVFNFISWYLYSEQVSLITLIFRHLENANQIFTSVTKCKDLPVPCPCIIHAK